jgi:hypothetical protein
MNVERRENVIPRRIGNPEFMTHRSALQPAQSGDLSTFAALGTPVSE